jgi:ABC-2 type transport system ATP-binding protein
MMAVEVNHLIKSFSGKTAVNDLSFSVVPGEIVGLIGPNGAGKSTAIKTILDFIKPDSGDVTILGNPLNEANKNQLGYLPEERGLYKKLPVMDLIIYLASLKGMDKHSVERNANELLHQAGMLSNKKMKIEEMSKGMGQMIQWIVTIIHDPKLIILDEPFSGLDPVNTDLLKRMLGNLRDRGKAVILSTHQMNEVEELCDRILMINNGCAVLYGDLKEIKSRYRNHSVLVDIEGELGEVPGVIEKRPHKGFVELVLNRDTTPQQVLEKLFNRGMIVKRFEMATLSLNEIFLKMVGKKDE